MDGLAGYEETEIRRLVLYLARNAHQPIKDVERMLGSDFIKYVESQDGIEVEIQEAYQAELDKIKTK